MTPEAVGSSPVRQAIANASQATGMDFGFLLATAQRESSLNPNAAARTSSAKGLFQFLDATWLNVVKRHGAKHGLSAEASMIQTTGNGGSYVSDPSLRRRLLDLRYDPEISARMAAEFASDNADYIRARTGESPQAGDLYAAHFLGAGGAAELINAAKNQPWARAANLFPQAAAANRPVFYENGRALSVIEVLEGLRRTASQSPNAISPQEFANNGQVNNANRAQIWLSSMNQAMNSQTLGLLNGENSVGFGNNILQDPMVMAQFYQQSDDANQAQAMEMAASVLSSSTIAEALMPNQENEEKPNTSSLGLLRGTK